MHSASGQAASRSKQMPSDRTDGLLTLTDTSTQSKSRKVFPMSFLVLSPPKLQRELFFPSVLIFNGNDILLTGHIPPRSRDPHGHLTTHRSQVSPCCSRLVQSGRRD